MGSKSDSIHPNKTQETSGAVPGVTGRTPEVPVVHGVAVDVTLHPLAGQVLVAIDFAQELGAPSYRDDFSARAPEAAPLAAALIAAKALSDESARADAWAKYLKERRDQAWQHALKLSGQFKPHFDHAVENVPGLAIRYTKGEAFLGARAEVAARGAVTRRKNRASKKSNPA